VPGRFETGTLPYADLAGVIAAVEHLAGLAPAPKPAVAGRRARLLVSMAAVEAHGQQLFAVLAGGLAKMDHVTTYGRSACRTPTAYFTVAGHTPAKVAAALAVRGVNVWHGHNYAWELTEALGLRARGGAVRAGIVHYNDASDVDRLLAGIDELAC
jgi:selenocysteine lyase/cysteine desulfurase